MEDADLKYLCTEPPTGEKVRPRKYIGKINNNDIDKEYFRFISTNEEETVYVAEGYSKALKRNIEMENSIPD